MVSLLSFNNQYTLFCMALVLSSALTSPCLSSNNENDQKAIQDTLESNIQEVVNSSELDIYGLPLNFSTTLVNIVKQAMRNARLQLKPTCTPQNSSTLQNVFNRGTLTKCVRLTKVTAPGGMHTSKDIFILTTDSSCEPHIRHDSSCYKQDNSSYCAVATNIIYLGEDYFPPFLLQMQCKGCKFGHQCSSNSCGYDEHKSEVSLLKRVPGKCVGGKEYWERIDRNVTVACSCIRNNF